MVEFFQTLELINTISIISLLILWYVMGIISYIYFWTRKLDVTLEILPFILVFGICGPIWWISNWFDKITSSIPNVILFKKRD